MDRKQQPKVRLVKCPRCTKLLEEPVHVPLYICGGCDTTLKAKYYKGHLKDIPLTSQGKDGMRSNGTIHARNNGESSSSSRRSSSSGEPVTSQEKGRDKDDIDNSRNSEQNGAVDSSKETSLSSESIFLKDKEIGVIENKLENNVETGRAEDAAISSRKTEQNGAASSSHSTALSEESSFIAKKETGENDCDIDQVNSRDQVSKGFVSVVEKKEPEQRTMAKSATDLNGEDELHNEIAVDNHQQEQIGDVKIGSEMCAPPDCQVLEKKELPKLAVKRELVGDEGEQKEQKQIGCTASSSLAEFSGIRNSLEHDASVHAVSKEIRNMNLRGEHQRNSLEHDASVHAVSEEIRNMNLRGEHQAEQKKMGHVKSSEGASSLALPSVIKNSVGTDDSYHEVSGETREMHLVGKHHSDEQNKVGCVNSAKDTSSSLLESSVIKNPTEYPMHVVSNKTRELRVVGKHSHQDQDEKKQTKYVNSSEDFSPLIVSSSIENPVGPGASDDEVSEETIEVPLVRKRFQRDHNEHKQVRYVNSDKDTALLSESPNIKTPTEYSNQEVSKETRKIHLVGEHPDHDQHAQKQTGNVNSSNEASSLTVSSAIKNSVIPNASDCEVSEKSRKKHLVEEDSQQDQKQDPAKDTSSKNDSSARENLTQLAPACEDSDKTRMTHLLGKHSHQVISGSEFNHLDVDVSEEVERSGKESSNGVVPNNFVECIVEQRGNLNPSSEASLSTNIAHGGKDSVSSSSSANNLKSSVTVDPTKVSRDSRSESISDKGKRASKQNVDKSGDVAVYTSAKVGSSLKEVPSYYTKRSPAYDGSVSSFDGNDDEVAEHTAHVGEETFSPTNAVAGYDEESPEWTNTMSEKMRWRNSGIRTQAISSSSDQLDKKFKSSMVEEGGPLEEREVLRKVSRYRPYRDNFPPRVPNRRRSSDLAFETGSSSSYLHDEPPGRPMHHPPYRRFLELPRWRENEFLPTYYNSETSGEIYDRPKHHAYVDGRRRTESWSQSGTFPRRPYSGEIFNGRYPCMHQYPDDRRWSAQLPPPAVCFHQGVYMGPAWETRWDPYDSYPTSPQRFVEPEPSYAWGHDTVSLSDDQRHKDQIRRRMYLREKRQAPKRHFHPTAGGAPFISCYSCFNILQIPEDFLISKSRRRTHKLQCGACSSVLEFSLESESGLAHRETNLDRNGNQAVSSSHVNHSRHSSLNSIDGRELLSCDSFKASSRDQRKLAYGSSRRGERMEGVHDDDDNDRGRPSKVSWQLPARSKSPLHRLMGYSSPKDLLSLHEADDLM